MALKLGTTAINALRLGATVINQAFLGATEVFSGVSVTLPSIAVADNDSVAFGDGFASVTVTFARNGTWTSYTLDSTTPFDTGDWIAPKSATVGDGYWIRYTPTSGTFSSGSTSWQQLSSNRSVIVSQSGEGTKSCTFTIEIATDSGGSNVVDTQAGNTMTAEVVAE